MEAVKHHLKCGLQSFLWVILTSLGLIIPIAICSYLIHLNPNLAIDFSISKFLISEKNLVVFCLTLVITSFWMYNSSKCESKTVKYIVIIAGLLAIVVGLMLFISIVLDVNHSNVSNSTFYSDNYYFAIFSLIYAISIKYHLNNKFEFAQQ